MNEYVYAAELAGLGYSLANTKSGIALTIRVSNTNKLSSSLTLGHSKLFNSQKATLITVQLSYLNSLALVFDPLEPEPLSKKKQGAGAAKNLPAHRPAF